MTRNLGRKFMHPKSQDPQFRVFDRDLWSSLLNNSFSSICNLMWTLNWGLLSSGPCIDRLFHLRGPALGCAWKWIRVKQLLLTWMLLVRLDCFFKSWNHFLHWNVPYWKFCDCINCDQFFLLWNVNLITEEFKYFRKVYSTWYELYEFLLKEPYCMSFESFESLVHRVCVYITTENEIESFQGL